MLISLMYNIIKCIFKLYILGIYYIGGQRITSNPLYFCALLIIINDSLYD